jgi:beta-lactamase class A
MSRLTRDLVATLAREAGLATPSIVLRRLTVPDTERPSPAGGRLEVELEADLALYPASMIKTPIAAALTTLWATGALGREETVEVDAANMTANDLASPLVPGYVASLEEVATLMLTLSDNVATNVLIDVIGRERVTRLAATAGLEATAVRRKLSGSVPLIDDPEATGRNTHPARDAALLFEKIAGGRIPGAEWLHSTLLDQRWNEKLSAGLWPEDRFAHKTGDTDEVAHDGGILDLADGRRYIVVVYTSLASSPAADARFAEFMGALRGSL